jgi:hypothetical protein
MGVEMREIAFGCDRILDHDGARVRAGRRARERSLGRLAS